MLHNLGIFGNNLLGNRFPTIHQIPGTWGLGQISAFKKPDGEGILKLLENIHAVMEEKKIDKCVFWLGSKPVLVLANRNDISKFKVKHEDRLKRGVPLLDEFLGDTILNESKVDWEKEREIIEELTHQSTNLRVLFPTILNCAREHIERAISNDEKLNYKNFFNAYSLDVFTSEFMGVKNNEATLKGFVDLLNQLTETVFQFVSVIKFSLPEWLRNIFYPGQLNNLDQIREQMKILFCELAKVENAAPLLEALNDAFYHSDTVDVAEQFGRLILLVSAGSATTAATLQFAITMLEAHPEVKEKLFVELRKINLETINFDNINAESLPYLDSFINEIWRLFPPTPFYLPREVSEPFELKLDNGEIIQIEKGDIIMATPLLAGRLSTMYQNSEIFNPDRFTVNHEPVPLPFSIGDRQCPGRNLAKLEIKAMLISLLKTTNLILDSTIVANKTDIELTFRGSMTPKMPLIGSMLNIGESLQNNLPQPN